jgi:hypothetical protein
LTCPLSSRNVAARPIASRASFHEGDLEMVSVCRLLMVHIGTFCSRTAGRLDWVIRASLRVLAGALCAIAVDTSVLAGRLSWRFPR